MGEAEKLLLAGTVKLHKPLAQWNYQPDTSRINQCRKSLRRFRNDYSVERVQASQQLSSTLSRLQQQLKKERRAAKMARRKARAQFMSERSPKEWSLIAGPIIKGSANVPIKVDGPTLQRHFATLFYKENANPPPAYIDDGVPTDPRFSSPFSEEEVQIAVNRLRNSAAGEDRVTADQIKQLDVTELTAHLNRVVREQQVPVAWRRSIVVAIPKSGQDSGLPENLRGIALQSAMRKLFTSLLTVRVQEYAEENGLLPPLQNGFRLDHRTADNIFVLRTLHELALEEETPLYVAQIDLRKAFDTVDRPTLFRRLYSMGVKGPLIEVLRQSYLQQEVSVRADKRYSDMLKVNTGVPQGDPLSPLLFILYVAHFDLSHPSDPTLRGNKVPFLALADDFTVTAASRKVLEEKLRSLDRQCLLVHLSMNPAKCSVFHLGTAVTEPEHTPITLHGITVPRRYEITINGYLLKAELLRKGWDTDSTALKQNRRAINTFRNIMTTRHDLGLTTPYQVRQLYLSHVASQLNYALESRFDVLPETANILSLTQKSHLRRMAGLHPRSITNILFRDFALLSNLNFSMLRSVKFFEYASTRPESRPVRWAVEAQQRDVRYGWYYRLRAQLAIHQIDLNYWKTRPCMSKDIDKILWDVENLTLRGEIAARPRMMVWKYAPASLYASNPQVASYLHHPFHLARACARLRTSSHQIAVQRFRMNTRSQPRHERRCPTCGTYEDEFHALLVCPEHALARSAVNSVNLMHHCLVDIPRAYAQFLYDVLAKIDRRYAN